MSNRVDITILTDPRYINPDNTPPLIRNVLIEDQLVQQALELRGFIVNKVAWSDPQYNWSDSSYLLFRTTWDYFRRFDEFLRWLKQTSRVTRLINHQNLIYWNLNKNYLQDLANKGIRTLDTVYVGRGLTDSSLENIAVEKGWKDLVIKPVVSASAMDTYLVPYPDLSKSEPLFSQLVNKQDMMVQEAQQHILQHGEFSLVMIGGKFSHGVLKVAKKGEFRVQDDFGGSVHEYHPRPAEIAMAEKAVLACDPSPVYARVDMIYDNDGYLSLVELELIEPELWFRKAPKAANLLAEAIETTVEASSPLTKKN